MKVVLIDRSGRVVGYGGLENLPSEAGQDIPDIITTPDGRAYLRQDREVPREVRWNCEAVFKEAVSGTFATPLYAEKVDGLVLRAIADLTWLIAQERSVERVDDPYTAGLIAQAESLLTAWGLNPPNRHALEDLMVLIDKAKDWVKPGRYRIGQVVRVTPGLLVLMLRIDGRRMRPVRWAEARLLADGYCCIERRHTFVQHTPQTVGSRVSPAITGAQEAIDQFGDVWEIVA